MATVYKLVLATRNLEFCFSSMAGTDKVEYACDPGGQESCIGTRHPDVQRWNSRELEEQNDAGAESEQWWYSVQGPARKCHPMKRKQQI